jgi:hypothetical protein
MKDIKNILSGDSYGAGIEYGDSMKDIILRKINRAFKRSCLRERWGCWYGLGSGFGDKYGYGYGGGYKYGYVNGNGDEHGYGIEDPRNSGDGRSRIT